MGSDGRKIKAIGYRQIPNAAFETDQITSEGYRTLAAVQFYDRMGSNGRGCDAPLSTLATKALCDVRTVRRWLARLTSMGLLETERRFGRGVTSIYRVVYEQGEKVDSKDPLYANERWTDQTEKVDSAIFESEQEQIVIPPKDTLKDTNAKLRRIRFDESARFPEKPSENVSGKDYVSYLSQMDRIGRKSGLPRDKVEDVLDISEALMSLFENGTPEYGIACRIIDSYYLVPEGESYEQTAE